MLLPNKQLCPVVVESNASKISNCVVVIVLLLTKRNIKATKTILFEFIFKPPFTKYAYKTVFMTVFFIFRLSVYGNVYAYKHFKGVLLWKCLLTEDCRI